MDFYPEATLDYHNRGSLDPFDIELLLTRFIEESLIANHKQVLVITGKGRVVRPIVMQLLRQHKQVASYNTAGYFNGQDGAIEVELK